MKVRRGRFTRGAGVGVASVMACVLHTPSKKSATKKRTLSSHPTQVAEVAEAFLRVGTEVAIASEAALASGVHFHQPPSFSTMTVTFGLEIAEGREWNLSNARKMVAHPFVEKRGMPNQLMLGYEGSSLMLGAFGRRVNMVGVRNFDEAATALADYMVTMDGLYESGDLEALLGGDFGNITIKFGMVNIVTHADIRIDIGKMYDALTGETWLGKYTPSISPGKMRVTIGEPWTKTSGVVKVDVPSSGRITVHVKGARGLVNSADSLKNVEERMMLGVRCVFDVLGIATTVPGVGAPGGTPFPTRTVAKKRTRTEFLAGYERDAFVLVAPAM